MKAVKLKTLAMTALISTLMAGGAFAQISGNKVTIGILNDQAGIFAHFAGPGSVEAARMAVEDFGGTVAGVPVDVVAADHQNNPDIGSTIAREWYDARGVDVIMDFANTTVALAVQTVARDRGKMAVFSAASGEALTQDQCSPTSIAYTYDTYSLAHVLAPSLIGMGLDTWFFITSDFASGHATAKNFRGVIEKSGGKVLGEVAYPLETKDFSSFILQAQASGSKGIVMTAAGENNINLIKQTHEFGVQAAGQKVAPTLFFMTDVHGLGLENAQGLPLSTAFYWDMNDETRAFSKKYMARTKAMPNDTQAGIYSAVTHYLKAIDALKSDDALKVTEWMKANPVNDFFAKNGTILPNGRMYKEMYLMEVKKPEESKGEWDLLKLVKTVPASEAFRPIEETTCGFVKKKT